MINNIQQKTAEIIKTTTGLGGVGLIIVENNDQFEEMVKKAQEELFSNNYSECLDYLEIVDELVAQKDKIFYIERGEKLEDVIVKIADDFHLGRVVVMDNKNHSGMKVAQFDPAKVSFVILINRQQLEASYPKLMEYVKFTQTI